MKVLILGATGLVGRNALTQALAHPAVTKVIAPTRKPLAKQDKLTNPVATKLEQLLPEVTGWGADAAICASGCVIFAKRGLKPIITPTGIVHAEASSSDTFTRRNVVAAPSSRDTNSWP